MMRNGLDPGGASASASRMRPSREAIDMEDVNAGNTPNHLAGKGKKNGRETSDRTPSAHERKSGHEYPPGRWGSDVHTFLEFLEPSELPGRDGVEGSGRTCWPRTIREGERGS